MNKQVPYMIGGVVLAAASFVGGSWYGAKAGALLGPARTAQAGRFAPGAGFRNGAGGAGFRGGMMGGGGTAGTVSARTATSLTVTMPDGSTKTVTLTPQTTVSEYVSTGKTDDIKADDRVFVTGTANADGSVTATSVQIQPARPATGSAQ